MRTTHQRRTVLLFSALPLLTIALSVSRGSAVAGERAAPSGTPAAAASKLQFNRDILPILSDNCFHCHGPDKNNRQAGLRLDMPQIASDKGAIAPGKPDRSSLIARIYATDGSQMPPVASRKSLTTGQKDTLKRWIAQGAQYQAHWAYIAPTRPVVPTPKPPKQATSFVVRNPIDAFILQRLNVKNIAPSREADRRLLLRRVSLDLTGLPPTPQEVNAFLADKSPNAYEKVADRLLAGPHYGERMAVPWLDVVRYADTVGFHGDQNQNAWAYRDYVIDAFNHNKPFDQFTIEQLAGDLLPNPTPEQRAATCFNRLNMVTREGGAQPKEYLAKYTADRVRTVSMAWLGSTFGCAECHDHKYDPISQKDFYALGAFFADVKQWGVYADYTYTPNPDLRGYNNDYPFPPEIKIENRYLKERIAKQRAQLDALALESEKSLRADPNASAAFAAWRAASRAFLAAHPDGWETDSAPEVSVTAAAPAMKSGTKKARNAPGAGAVNAAGENLAVAGGDAGALGAKTAQAALPAASSRSVEGQSAKAAEYKIEPDHSVLLTSATPGNVTLALHPTTRQIAALRLELLPHAANANIIFRKGARETTLTLAANILRANGKREPITFRYAGANIAEPQYANGFERIGVQRGWKISQEHAAEPHVAVWLPDKPLALTAGEALTVTLPNLGAGCVRVAVSPFVPAALNAPGMAPNLNAALVGYDKSSAAQSNPERALVLRQYLWSSDWDARAFARAKTLEADIANCREGITPVLVTEATAPMTMRVLPRGNWQDETGPLVEPATPHFLSGPASAAGQRLSRLDLARWIVSPQNPLTSRVIVNRLWKQFFGNGLSMQVEDLGAQGEWPSHPELLDWLAVEFRDRGWDIKRIVRLIVTSSTYRQSSSLRPELREIDPNNRLLASQNPRRLEAEFVRDNALAIAGLLNPDLGGPSCKPYQPEGYYANIQFPDRNYITEMNADQYRRGVYMHWQRTFLQPMLANFDAPSREDCIASRTIANTPQQALTLLNDPTFVEAARVFAAQLLTAAPTASSAKPTMTVSPQNAAKPAKTTAGGASKADAGASADEIRLEMAFQRALARSPRAAEKQSLLAFLATVRKAYQAQPGDAAKLLQTGIAPIPASLDTNELAAWTNVCRVILNLNETITRY